MIFKYPIYESIKLRDYLESFYLSKSKIYKLFFEKKIFVNNLPCKETDILNEGDIVSINLDEEIDYIPVDGKLDIIYEDDYYLIINKPKNILIHNEKNNDDALCNLVAGYYKKNNMNINVRFAHRLDYETTGLIVFCKDILTLSYMNHFIETHEIRRKYVLLAQGSFKPKCGTYKLPIGKHRHINGKMIVSNTGSEATTHYELIKEFKGYSLVRAILETGRTHQIRVHFSYSGHPLLGDTLYGGNKNLIGRVALHSRSIEFIHPVFNKNIKLEAEMPEDIKKLI